MITRFPLLFLSSFSHIVFSKSRLELPQSLRFFCESVSLKATGREKTKLLSLLRTMPRDMDHVIQIQKQRQQKKAAKTSYPPSVAKLVVLGPGAIGAPRSLYVFTDQKCYLFNCGEGTQRIAHEQKTRLAKVENIFFTRTSWANVGGLPGASLTIQDIGIPELKLHGPRGLDDVFHATSRFIILDHLKVLCLDATATDGSFEDSVLKIDYVPVWPAAAVETTSPGEGENSSASARNPSPIEEDDTDNYYNRGEGPVAKRTRTDGPPAVPPTKDLQAGSRPVVAYICRLHAKKGTLLPDKCFDLGVPAGPLFGRLKDGQDVTLADGRVVSAADVRTPDDPGPAFVVVECPDESYLDNFVNEPRLAGLPSLAGQPDGPQVVVHFTPAKIVEHPKYQAWMDGFGKDTTHMMVGFSATAKRGFGSVAVHRLQHKLHLLNPDVFPLLPIDMPVEVEGEEERPKEEECHPCTAYWLRPKKKLDTSSVPHLNIRQYTEETLAVEGFPAALEASRKAQSEAVPFSDRTFPRITFFGTGSSIPNKTRNTSAILVEIESERFMLMDCGEGTYGQIVRFYGPERAAQVLSKLVAVYISHLHADHHIGLIGLLLGRKYSLEVTGTPHSPVQLLAPQQINYWLKQYHYNFEAIRPQYHLVPLTSLMADQPPDASLLNRLGLGAAVTTRVPHCPNAFGVAFTTRDGYKWTYSGDTMPSRNLIELGRGSDLLIHEATMEDGMEEDAKKKAHSTTSQAIEVGRSMGAKFTLLTHFSQRYSRIPQMSEGGLVDQRSVGVAFDHMCVAPNQLHLLPTFAAPLPLMFADHQEVITQRAEKRRRKAAFLEEKMAEALSQ